MDLRERRPCLPVIVNTRRGDKALRKMQREAAVLFFEVVDDQADQQADALQPTTSRRSGPQRQQAFVDVDAEAEVSRSDEIDESDADHDWMTQAGVPNNRALM